MEFNNCIDIALCSIPQTSLGQFATMLNFFLAFVFPLALLTALYTKMAIFLHKRVSNGMIHIYYGQF